MKKLLLLFIVFLSIATHAETLFVKANGQPLTDQEHTIVYQIMLETQFPMSMRFGHFAENEIEEMNRKIEAQLPQSEIIAQFIPTTLYELLALLALQESCLYKKNYDPISQLTGDMLKTYFTKTKTCKVEQSFPPLKQSLERQELLTQPLMLEQLRPFHKNINEFIIRALKTQSINPSLLDDALDALEEYDFWNIAITQGLNTYKIRKKIVQQTIKIEHKAHLNKTFPLYRGSEYADFDVSRSGPSLQLNRSISFGMSLLAGCLFDNAGDGGENGACAYTYICCLSKFGYAVPISMKEYARGNLSNMFYIPPIPTLLGLISHGESFHPRSKVVDVSREIVGLDEDNKENIQQLQINTQQLPARNVYSHMLYYIKEHHIPIKK